MALETELETFRRNLPDLLRNRGKVVLIHGDKIDSIWPTLEQALDAGYEKFGLEPFLAKEITQEEKPRFFSRSVTRCQ